MKIYSIFDDFDNDAINIIEAAGGELTVHPTSIPRPDNSQMKAILEEYDVVIIGTSQKITKDMFDSILTPRIIATASVGIDHIIVPLEKKNLVTIINTPKANAQSVAEYTIGCALICCKRIVEGDRLYRQGQNKKKLFQKPVDLTGKTIGVIGAGSIAERIMDYAAFFDMEVLCWTRNPEHHKELEEKGIKFTTLEMITKKADVISVNLPNTDGTKGLISYELVSMMKKNTIFISVSRLETIDVDALMQKAWNNHGFYVCLDLDVNETVISKVPDSPNVIITPHLAGGTVESRKRMFREVAYQIAERIKES